MSCGGDSSGKQPYHAPTEAEAKAFAAQIAPLVSRTPADVRIVARKNGAKHIDILSGYQNVVIARTNADGSISRACVDSTEQAQQFMLARNPAAPAARATQWEAR